MKPSHKNPLAQKTAKSLTISLLLTFLYFITEFFGGLFTGSLALIADSMHMAGDFFSLGIACLATYLARRPTNLVKTYGYHRIEVLSAIVNAMALWVISGAILSNALKRLVAPPEIQLLPMSVIAFFGLVINIVCATILSKQSKTNLNVRGAYLHVLSDTLGSISAIMGALLIKITGNFIFDPLVSGFICLLIILSSLKLITNAFNILLEGAPPHLNVESIHEELLGIEDIDAIHDLHIWSLGAGMDILTAHLLVSPKDPRGCMTIVEEANALLKEKFGIEHTTLQPEVRKKCFSG